MDVDLIAKAEAKLAKAHKDRETAQSQLAAAELAVATWAAFLERARELMGQPTSESKTAPSVADGDFVEGIDNGQLRQPVRQGTLPAKIIALMQDQHNRPMTVSEIADILASRGKVVPGQNLRQIVRNTLRRRSDLFVQTLPGSGMYKLTMEKVPIE